MDYINLKKMINDYKIPYNFQDIINGKLIKIEVNKFNCIGFCSWSYSILYIKPNGISTKHYEVYKETYTDRWNGELTLDGVTCNLEDDEFEAFIIGLDKYFKNKYDDLCKQNVIDEQWKLDFKLE